jgi:hypothetical protein
MVGWVRSSWREICGYLVAILLFTVLPLLLVYLHAALLHRP